jgi:hypothetical protein
VKKKALDIPLDIPVAEEAKQEEPAAALPEEPVNPPQI